MSNQQKDPTAMYVGREPTNTYLFAAMSRLTQHKAVTLRAMGESILNAISLGEQLKRLGNTAVWIETGTYERPRREPAVIDQKTQKVMEWKEVPGRMSRLSTIAIRLVPSTEIPAK